MQTTVVTDFTRHSLSELVIELPSAMQVFRKYDLDFCCGGKRSLEDACMQRGLQPRQILSEIENTTSIGENFPLHINQWSTGLLIDFIVENYHAYVRNSIPVVTELVDRICLVHGADYPFLLEVKEDFAALAEELLTHMHKEEIILFPALRELSEGEARNPIAKMIDRPVMAMEEEHELAATYLRSIRSLTKDYTPPAHACTTFRLAYQKLQEFDRELINHIHLENNVLFKRVPVA